MARLKPLNKTLFTITQRTQMTNFKQVCLFMQIDVTEASSVELQGNRQQWEHMLSPGQ